MTHEDLVAELQVQADAHEALTAKYQAAIKALLFPEARVTLRASIPLTNGHAKPPPKAQIVPFKMNGAERRAAILAVLGKSRKSRDGSNYRVPLRAVAIAGKVGDSYVNIANSLSVLKAQGMVFHAARGTWGITKKGAKS